jgi:WD40 repeat protein
MAKLQAGDPEHPEPITVFFSPDGGQIATVSRAKIVITDTATNTEVAQLAQREIITAGAFSDDGTRIATASLDNTVRLWDALTGAELRRLVGHSDSVDSVAFSPNSALLVTTSWDKTARVWSVETGQLLHTLVGHADAVLSGAFSPDGTEVVTGSKDYTARVWDAATGALKQTLLGNHEEVIAAEFSLDGYLVGTATRHAAIKWDAYTGRMVYRLDPLTRTNSR